MYCAGTTPASAHSLKLPPPEASGSHDSAAATAGKRPSTPAEPNCTCAANPDSTEQSEQQQHKHDVPQPTVSSAAGYGSEGVSISQRHSLALH